MQKPKSRFLLSLTCGVILLSAGVVLLLSNLEIITIDWEMVVGPLMAGIGMIFLLIFITNTSAWWSLIPGFVLIGLAINTFIDRYPGIIDHDISGAIMFASIGLPFIVIYLSNHQQWWALIPGGVLLTMAVSSLLPGETAYEGGLFFIGLALTFGLVYFLPKPSGRLQWALFPAGALLLLGVLTSLRAASLLRFLGPLTLLIIGGYLIYRSVQK